MSKPKFDPSKPFEVVSKPKFDPSKPFEIASNMDAPNPDINVPFVPKPVQETSNFSKLATGVLNAGQTVNTFQDEIAGGIRGTGKSIANVLSGQPANLKQNVYNEIDNVRAMQNELDIANPNSALTGKLAGVGVGIGATGGMSLGKQAAMTGAQFMGSADDGSVLERGGMAALGAALPYGINKAGNAIASAGKSIGEISAVQKALEKTKALGAKGIKGLSNGLKRMGFQPSDIREAAEELADGTAGTGNPLVQLKLLADEGVLKGKNSTVEINKALKSTIKNNGSKLASILEKQGSKIKVNSAVAIEDLPFDQDLLNTSGLEVPRQIRLLLQKTVPNILDGQGNIKPLTLQQAQSAKNVLQDYVNYDAAPDLAKIHQHGLKLLEKHLRAAIEESSPEIAKLNAISSAALKLQEKTLKLENSPLSSSDIGAGKLKQSVTNLVKNPFFSGGAAGLVGAYAAPLVGLDRSTGLILGAGAGFAGRTALLPESLPNSLKALEGSEGLIPKLGRSMDAIGSFLSNNPGAIPQSAIPFLQDFNKLPKEEQEKLGPELLKQAESLGIPVEPSQSGYASEFNGKIQDPVERLSAAQSVFKLTQTGGLSILDAAKQIQALNSAGHVPPSLIKPQQAAPVPAPAPQPAAPAPQIPTKFEDQAKLFK